MRNVNSSAVIWSILLSSLLVWGVVLYISGTKLEINALWKALKQLPTVVTVEGNSLAAIRQVAPGDGCGCKVGSYPILS